MPLSPEQIKTEQRRTAETELAARKAALPAVTNGGTAVAVPDSRTAAERNLNTVAPEISSAIEFDGKEGKVRLAGTGEAVDPQRKFKLLGSGAAVYWIKFGGEGELPERVGGLLNVPDVLPPRESLGDNDAAAWPISKLTGKPGDPWQLQLILPLEDCETAEVFIFRTTSKTGRTAVGAILRAYNRMTQSHPGEVPVVQLVPSSYTHRTFGKVYIPGFVVVGRAKADGAPLTLAQEMDDEIPFAL